jgi:hypothetical protein
MHGAQLAAFWYPVNNLEGIIRRQQKSVSNFFKKELQHVEPISIT